MISNMWIVEWYLSLGTAWQVLITVINILLLISIIAYAVHKNKINEKEEFKDFVEKYYSGKLNYRGGRYN